jgi:predicted dehydrogenase
VSTTDTAKVGIIGCGNISGIYFENCRRFKNLEVVACADLDLERAKAQAEKYGVARVLTPEQLLADPEVEVVINLTIPSAHAAVALAAVEAGKHVYNEKPLTAGRADGRKLLDIASKNNVRVGCAPDTFFGSGHQTARRLIDDGAIGEPVAATAFMMGRGPEGWHPNPTIFYQPGAGPLLDMGPYYITALINMLGGVRRVTGSARASFAERVAGHETIKGQKVPVETPTHVAGTLDFASGPIATIVTSFDIHAHQHTNIEVYGSEGSLLVPDPNGFAGVVKIRRGGESEWTEAPHTQGYEANSRAVGVADMASAAQEGRPHRARGALAYHTLDIMLSILDSSETGRHIELSSGVERPVPVPEGIAQDEVD